MLLLIRLKHKTKRLYKIGTDVKFHIFDSSTSLLITTGMFLEPLQELSRKKIHNVKQTPFEKIKKKRLQESIQ
jgi:hypothetical protein